MDLSPERSFLLDTAKSNIRCFEACASLTGVIKCFSLFQFGVMLPNVHLRIFGSRLSSTVWDNRLSAEALLIRTDGHESEILLFGFDGTGTCATASNECVVWVFTMFNTVAFVPRLFAWREISHTFARLAP